MKVEKASGRVGQKRFQKLIASDSAVSRRIDELAGEILNHYRGRHPLFICLLRGGAPFAGRLMFAITKQNPNFSPELDYMTIRTYGDKLTGGAPKIVMDLSPKSSVKDRPVVLVDDVLDMGITASFTKRRLVRRGASSVKLVVLVQKQTGRTLYGDADWFGFEAPADWLTGMGMDDPRIGKEANRWMSSIALANPEDR